MISRRQFLNTFTLILLSSVSLLCTGSEKISAGNAPDEKPEASLHSLEAPIIKKDPEPVASEIDIIPQVENPAANVNETDAPLSKAESVELDKPVLVKENFSPEEDLGAETAITSGSETDTSAEIDKQDNQAPDISIPPQSPLILLGSKVVPSTSTRLSWSLSQSFEGIAAPTPVLVAHGAKPGPVLCLTAAVHGDELNGIEIVRRILYSIDVEKLSGTIIGVPIVNLQGFRRSSRYLSDRRDLNRFFPGNPDGSSASRIAYSFFNEIISKCDALIDLHTGSFHRTNLPQLRADLTNPKVVELTQGFGATVILHSDGAQGTLRRAAVDIGIPAVTLEAGEPMRLQDKQVSHGVKGIQTLLNKLGMYDYSSFWGDPEPVYYKSAWVRANRGGILFSKVDLGDKVEHGELLGTVTDPITNVRTNVYSPYNGRIIGMALNQVVMPGFAAFHIGIQTTEDEIQHPDEKAEPVQTLHTSSSKSDQPGAPDKKQLTLEVEEPDILENSE